MAQARINEYRDPDSTYLLNQKYLGIIEPGIYRGYDVNLQAGLILELNHNTTGVREISITLSETIVGVSVTTQGVVIRDAELLSLPVAVGSTQYARIDRVVMTHQYVASEGGSQALYSIITGTPSITPVKPDFIDDKIEIEVGTIYIPKDMTSLDESGVVWTKAKIPTYSNSDIVTLLDSLTLKKASNLGDVEDIVQAKTNLGVITETDVNTTVSNYTYSKTQSVALFPTRHQNTAPSTTPRTIGVQDLPKNTYVPASSNFCSTLTLLTNEHCIYLENVQDKVVGNTRAFLSKITPPINVYEGYCLTVVCTGANTGLLIDLVTPTDIGYEVYARDETHIDCNLRLASIRDELISTGMPQISGFAVSEALSLQSAPLVSNFLYAANATLDLRWSTVANLWVEVGRSTKIS